MTAVADATTCAVSSGESHGLTVKALELMGGDLFCARRLLVLIAETNHAALVQLRDSFDVAAWDSVGSAAHRIAGSARMLECNELIGLLTQLEAAAREREIATAAALMQHVTDALEHLAVSIDAALDSVFQR